MIRQLIITICLTAVISCSTIVRGFVNITDAEIQVFPFDNNKHNIQKIQALHNGTFDILLIENASYMVTVDSPTHLVAPNRFRVDYESNSNDDDIKIWLLEFGDAFSAIADLNKVSLINITTVQKRDFIEKRNKLLWETGIILMLIENPVYLAIGLIALLISTLPVVLSYIDPDFDAAKIKQE